MTTLNPTQRAAWHVQSGQVFRRWTIGTRRQPWGVAFSLIQPVIWIVLFGQVFHTLGALPAFGTEGYISYLVPGILMMTVLYSGAWAGTGYITDIDSGVMAQYLTTPISRSALVFGQLGQQLTVNAAQSVAVVAIGWLAGARMAGGMFGVLLALAVATVLSSIFCCASAAVALTTRDQVALIGLSQLVVLPLTFLSTTMMPASLMPAWIQAVSRWNPMTWAVELGRGALNGAMPANAGWQAAGLIALALGAFAWAVSSLRAYQRSL